MSNLLDAVNTNTDKDGFIIGKLPTEPGEVSIMTLKQAYKALGGLVSKEGEQYDPTSGYNTSTYYMYAINDNVGVNDSESLSTKENIQSIGLNWFKQLNKPEKIDKHFVIGSHKVFGGPLDCVYRGYDNYYGFIWYYSNDHYDHLNSSGNNYWHDFISGSVYVAVVRSSYIKEDKIEMTKEELIAHGRKWLKDGYILNDKDRGFIEAAIKALEE